MLSWLPSLKKVGLDKDQLCKNYPCLKAARGDWSSARNTLGSSSSFISQLQLSIRYYYPFLLSAQKCPQSRSVWKNGKSDKTRCGTKSPKNPISSDDTSLTCSRAFMTLHLSSPWPSLHHIPLFARLKLHCNVLATYWSECLGLEEAHFFSLSSSCG